MDKIYEQRIEELENTIKKAQKQIEELKREDEMPKFKYPREGDKVWVIYPNGAVSYRKWDGDVYDKRVFRQGGIFFTKEEAEFEAEREIVIKELELFSEPKNRTWDTHKKHYHIEYNYRFKEIEIDFLYSYRHNDIYFESELDALNAINFVGEDRVKKYYLGVEE